jgi:hypothetical protein
MKDNKDIILLFLGIFIFVGLAWGPLTESRKNGTGIFSKNGSSFFGTNTEVRDTPTNTNTVSEKEISEQIKITEDTTKALQEKLKKEEELKKRSPYYGKINMSSISYVNSPDPNQEYITLYTNIDSKEKINITGWKLISTRSGNWVRIGGASTTPKPFVQNNKDVVLGQGDMAFIIKGFSPIGISFRSNKCTGYFGENRQFYPYINMQCPLAKTEKLPKFSSNLDREDECLDLIDRIPACTTPFNRTNINNLPDTVTDSCKNYLQTKVNYDSCVANHIGDTDFPGREWYVYLQVFGPLWRSKREHIDLLDNNGLIVSSIDINNY